MCKETNESVPHILNMCQNLTTSNYLKRHNNVVAILHRNICQHYRIKTLWNHHPESIRENKEVKVLWDFEVRADKIIPAQRRDVVAIDKTKRTTTAIDVAVPLDWKVKDKEDEKILKYQDLII